ncbi:hypothetical protein NCAS_0A08980 [Naumovozyma castellii]|uniref:RRM domain-containing protein n=1 Tax=Naumovozyma castellii TaxID=27288 RepID=G0V7K8_NAUCA|nr:hypothetical protein NCAS_0A08980 [Naumovozyma castellii CBS 4309]CCC67456.1 hypothetical protein NCAS_0A08980 [Naumovozyma castellii CBS 4309]
MKNLSLNNRGVLTSLSLNESTKFDKGSPKSVFKRTSQVAPSVRRNEITDENNIDEKPVEFRKNIPKTTSILQIDSNKPRDSRNYRSRKRIVTSLFINGLADDVTENMLYDVFSKYQSLVSLKICCDSDSKKSLNYGYLNFSDELEAKKAVDDFNYTILFGNEIKMMPSLRNTIYRKNIGTNVFFANLPLENKHLTTRAFYDTFKGYGEILSCKLDKRKNIGFVYFDNDKPAQMVINDFNNKIYFGNKIICGLHFDKEIRNFPNFDKRKANIDNKIIIDDELEAANIGVQFKKNSELILPHPNAIFVKNLPFDVPDEEILDHFSKLGPVKSVFSSNVTKYKSSWAFITYKKQTDTIRATNHFNNTKFQGKTITVSRAKLKNTEGNRTVYLNNVSVVCNQEFLRRLCLQEGIKAQKIYLKPDDHDSYSCSGYIKCNSKDNAKRVFEILNGKFIGGCYIHVSWDKIKDPLKDEQSDITQNKHNILPNLFLPNPAIQKHGNFISYKESNVTTEFISDKPSNHYISKEIQQIINIVNGHVKRGLEFLNNKVPCRDESIRCISEYIINVYWYGDLQNLSLFLQSINSNVRYEAILQQQIEAASNLLGLSET